MNVSIIIPWKPSKQLNIPKVEKGDEILLMTDGTIWEARFNGAMKARNEWLVFTDSDAVYPDDYIRNVKQVIVSGKYPLGFRTRRIGGFGDMGNVEASIIIPKNVFFSKTKDFDGRGLFDDFGILCLDLPIESNIYYYHDLTRGEKTAIIFGILFLGCLLK